MRNPAFIIKIAADDITRLRRVDVFRVLSDCTADELPTVAHYITTNRPELFAEVSSCMGELI